MDIQLPDLATVFDLEVVNTDAFRGVAVSSYRARAFGGQVAAQAAMAAGRTIDGKRLHSLHSYFLRPGDPATPILFDVIRLKDGRSFSTRRVVASQNGEEIYELLCSFHADEPGIDRQAVTPDISPPRGARSARERANVTATAPTGSFFRSEGLEFHFPSDSPWEHPRDGKSGQQFWVRAVGVIADDPLLHSAYMVLFSDLGLVTAVRRSIGSRVGDQSIRTASIDHSMWFLRPYRADHWLLYDQTSPSANGARGLSFGSMYDEAGALVASVAQEALVRPH